MYSRVSAIQGDVLSGRSRMLELFGILIKVFLEDY